ncbi:unnamed protein product [Cylindrotheca closterium]|uniref:SWIM-type domain-containing protein n=1 Tax=Cylindrotheca closterium TaxID=2856 RepID=A0AAD2FPC6_9STRA|nr:unnamed protein product [Cylindrotheca closterium]
MLGVENLKRVHLMLTDGDASEYNAVDQTIFRYVKNAICGRCGHHLIEKTFLKHGPKDSKVKNPSNGQAILLELRRWVRSWIDGTSCRSKKEFELSKALLLQELQTNQVLRRFVGDKAAEKCVRWILNHILTLDDQQFAFHCKQKVRCLHEYTTNATEGMNYAAKHSAMAAQPQNNMKTLASNMSAHMDIQNHDREYTQMRLSNSTPLYVSAGCTVHNTECIQKLVPIATSVIIEQMDEALDKYTIVQLSSKAFFLICAGPPSTLVRCPPGVKGRPKFRTAHKLDVKACTNDTSRVVLTCSCGFGHQYGIPCRHLIALEHHYDINDFACRWRSDYAYYAFKQGYEEITHNFGELQKKEHFGIVVKTQSLLKSITSPDQTTMYPRIFAKASCCKSTIEDLMDIYLSPIPHCWNYTLNEYPDTGTFSESPSQTNAYHTVETCSPSDYGNSDFAQDEESDDEEGDRTTTLAFNMNQLCSQQPKEQCQKKRAYNFQKFKDIDRNCMSQDDVNFVTSKLEAIDQELFERKALAMKTSQKRAFVGATGRDMVSFALNTETCKKSTQDTYHRKRIKRKGRR